ncbi:RHS repeat domain-containing protein [Sphaerisporangium fuscum]|uniref:RHS repeat domain-containing protein n=1 Tax=Sphaerisporangium fuscum TaxID=2835868 RepID=UPI001BDC6307|nr:RHS repeat-associated core domain-containing protein [Sphaerisporangium fuscum]
MNRLKWFAATLAASFVIPLPQMTSAASATPDKPHLTRLDSDERPVPGKAAPPRALPPDPERAVEMRTSPAVTWPGTGKGAVRALAGTGPQVSVLDRATTARAGVRGVLFRVGGASRLNGAAAGADVPVEIDYSGFRNAYGGDWASRLTVVRLPECALTTPTVAACAKPTATKSSNHLKAGKLSATLPAGGLFAVTAASGGSAGSYKPTSLSPSATWQVGTQSGDFTWSYPIDSPDLPGIGPDIDLSYSSSSVDGRVSATNNQPSWLGEGFDYQAGYIERSYKSCKDDGAAATPGDECWSTWNAHVVLPGVAGELVRDATDTTKWRVEEDDGWRVDLLTGAVNGDDGDAGKDKGEHWRLTSPDGTQYFFGLNRLPGWTSGKPETNSTWTVPVYGNNAGEPCNAAGWCQQAYRWSLDYVVDPHGDVMSIYYNKDVNHYARGGTAVTPYARGGEVDRIEYGQRDQQVYSTTAPGRVVFTTAGRCIPGSACTQASPQDWPDTPWDQSCDASSCAITSPTFWSAKRLAKITTQVYSDGGYRDVDSWTFTHSFPAAGDGSGAALWLDSIVHSGHTGGTLSLPPVRFDGTTIANRVAGDSDDRVAMKKRRLSFIYNETGGRVGVTYSLECQAGMTAPAPDANTKKCFPAFWTPEGAPAPELDWWQKPVVTQVVEEDLVGGNSREITQYEYFGDQDIQGAAWRRDDSELVPDKYKTWGQWRGFAKVRIRSGDPAKGPQDVSEQVFYRGMDGDLKAGGGTRTARVYDSQGGTRPDTQVLKGFVRETTEYNGPNGAWSERTVSEPQLIGMTAHRARPDGGPELQAWLTEEKTETTYTALAGGRVRVTENRRHFDSLGMVDQVYDLGDTSTTADDTCTTITYARNESRWIMDTRSQVVEVSAPCGTTPSYPGDLLSGKRYYYDGSTSWGAAPARGDVTKAEEMASFDGDKPEYAKSGSAVFDQHGRVTEEYDAYDHKETMSYTPATGGPLTSQTATNALGHTATTTFDPLRGLPAKTEDANAKVTELSYDALGRLTGAWLPGRSRTANPAAPNTEYTYTVRNTGPTAVKTKSLLGDGSSYVTSYSLMDGFLRERQTQALSPAGGRIVSDTFYDSQGRQAKSNAGYYEESSPPSASLWVAQDDAVPSQTVYEYDAAGRETAEILKSHGTEKWRTTTTYGGDWTAVDPPDGDTPEMVITDADGRTIERRQYHGGTPSGAYDATKYTYDKAGALESVTDPAGNVWRYAYDLRGRKVREEDPDTGVSTSTFDELDRVVSTTDSRGKSIFNDYDALGRLTATREGSATGPKLTERVYDTLSKGALTSTTRYAGGNVYRTETLGFDAAGRPTGTRVTIPAAEGGLQGTYDTTFEYNAADQIVKQKLPAGGGLPAETLQRDYDPVTGLAAGLGSALGAYVSETGYSDVGELASTYLGPTGHGVLQQFEYDEATSRLNRILAERDLEPAAISDVNLVYDPAGNVLKVADDTSSDVQCFTYDYLQRLTEAWTATDQCAGSPSLASLGGPEPYWHSYQYDETGNRTKEVRHASAGDLTRTYTYPEPGSPQPHTLRSLVGSGPDGTATDTYGYDSDGNTVSRKVKGVDQALAWDAEGHLASVTKGAETESYVYDADGDRLIRHGTSSTTLYLGDTELELKNGTVSGTRYYAHNGSVVAVRTAKAGGTSLSWLVSDHQGTQQAAVDAATLKATVRRSLPFGGTRDADPSDWPGSRGFVGGTKDPTGLTHLGAREYDPDTGRFVSVDPIIDVDDPQTMNGYAYGLDNPVTMSDPDGMKAKKCENPRQCDHVTPKAKTSKPKTKAKPKPRARCENPRQCDHVTPKPKTPKPKVRCENPRQCDHVTPKPKVRKCENPRQCDHDGPAPSKPGKQPAKKAQPAKKDGCNWLCSVGKHLRDNWQTYAGAVGLGVCVVASAGACLGVGAAIWAGGVLDDAIRNKGDVNWGHHAWAAVWLVAGGTLGRVVAGSRSAFWSESAIARDPVLTRGSKRPIYSNGKVVTRKSQASRPYYQNNGPINWHATGSTASVNYGQWMASNGIGWEPWAKKK